MKREVASSLVERGVAERVRLTQAYEKKKSDLQKQHDSVKAQFNEHKDKVCIQTKQYRIFSFFRYPFQSQHIESLRDECFN